MKRKTRPVQGISGRFVRAANVTPSSLYRAISAINPPDAQAHWQAPPEDLRGYGWIKRGTWYVTYEGKKLRAVELLYEYVYGQGFGHLHRTCGQSNCINPHHYTREKYMKLDPWQAEKVWLSLLNNPRKLTLPCTSAHELKTNRSALYRARNRLLKQPGYDTLTNYEVGKDDTGLNLLLQPSHVGTPEAEEQLRALGIDIHEGPTAQPELINPQLPTQPILTAIHPMTGEPINYDETIVESSEIINNLGYAPRTKINPDEKKT
jgi:hypothetical protein